MKRTLISLACVLVTTLSTLGQGTVNFANFPGTQRIYLPGGTTGAAVGSLNVALYWGPLGSTDAQLTQIGGLGGIAPLAGVFSSGTRTTGTTTAGGAMARFQVWAWSTGYNSYAEALASGDPSKYVGKSASFDNPTGNPGAQPPGTPAALTGFTSFSVAPVPEPSTIILGLLGAGALLLRRRK